MVTNEQAIEIITEYRDKLYDTIPRDVKEALGIAIKTLDLTKNQVCDIGFITAMKLYARSQGEWINTSPYDDTGECSLCCYLSKKYYNFCPNCGAVIKQGEK